MRFLRDNGLTLVLLGLFTASFLGMLFAGWGAHNEELAQHGDPAMDLLAYFFSPHFQTALFENWESEFLQMGTYVVLTAFLYQRGSSESKDPDEPAAQEEDPRDNKEKEKSPWPVRAGGLWLVLYSYSLGLLLFAMFIASFVLHWLHSADEAAQEAVQHGAKVPGVLEHLASAQLWFESFQNWQSEFLATAVLVVFSIALRFKGSPESKPVAAPLDATGR